MGVHQSAPLTYPAGQLPTFLTGSGSAIAAIVEARRMRTPPSGGAIPLTAPPPTHRRYMCAGQLRWHAPSIPDPFQTVNAAQVGPACKPGSLTGLPSPDDERHPAGGAGGQYTPQSERQTTLSRPRGRP